MLSKTHNCIIASFLRFVKHFFQENMKFGGMNLDRWDISNSNRLMASEIIEKCLEILNDEEKLQSASVSQLTGAISSLSDNFLGENDSAARTDDPLSKSIFELEKDLRSDKPQ